MGGIAPIRRGFTRPLISLADKSLGALSATKFRQWYGQHRVLVADGWMFRSDPSRTGMLIGLIVLQGTISLSLIWVIGRIGIGLTGTLSDRSPVWFWLVTVGLLQLLRPLIGAAVRWLSTGIGHRLERALRERVMAAAGDPQGISHLETPAGASLFATASGASVKTFSAEHIALASAGWAGTRAQGLAAAFLLWVYAPWAPFLIWAAWSVFPSWIARQTRAQVAANEAATLGLRRADYLRGIALSPAAAMEVRLFGLDAWLGGQFTQARTAGLQEATHTRHRGRWGFVPLLLVPALASLGVGYGLIAGYRHGSVEFANLVMGVTALIAATEIGRTMAWWTRAWHGVDVLTAVDRLPATNPASTPMSGGGLAVTGRPREAIAFKDLAFGYPAQPHPVFQALNLAITAGTSNAIVGVNGAGKTTLVKLLARLYDPTAGRITLDGVDLRDYDLACWRRQLAVVSQNFVKYPATLRENVWPGLPPPTSEQWQRVCDRADLAGLLAQLPAGADTLLASGYAAAVELSGGQWQRVALARALAAVERGAKVLVLDEPTANLDIRGEAELFAQFLDLTKGLTTLLITHRMASVLHVDRVFVIEEGRVVETGNPRQLLKQGGHYADLFRLQADRFTQDGHA